MTKFLLALFFVFSLSIVHAQELWKFNTAVTYGKNKGVIGLFQPSVYGVTNWLDVAVNPLQFVVYPNVRLTANLWNNKQNFVSTRVAAYYPTMAARIEQKQKLLGWFSDDLFFSPQLIFKYEMIYSRNWKYIGGSKAQRTSGKVMLMTATESEHTFPGVPFEAMDLRSFILNRYNLLGLEMKHDAQLTERLNLTLDIGWYKVIRDVHYSFEHKCLLSQRINHHYMVQGGYSFKVYPNYLKQLFFSPVIDVMYLFGI